MRYLILIMSILTTALYSCQKDDLTELPSEDNESAITFNLQSDNIDVVQTRTLTPEREKYIREANIYCFNTITGKCQWVYMTGTTTVKMKLSEGVWDVYVTANNGRFQTDNRAEVENISPTIAAEADLERYDVLPMKAKTTITVSGNIQVPITLTRIVAKVEVSVTVASALRDKIHLQNISLKNVPSGCTYFKSNAPVSGMIDYADRTCTNGTATSFYMLENCQGTNNAISDQRYKGRDNAPKNASYLHIKAATDDKLLDYYIYLGANNTTDFNVAGNKNYVVKINITGINETDWRVEVGDLTKITVKITQADRTTVNYRVDGKFIASDNTLDVAVELSKPSLWDITIPIQGVLFLFDDRVIIPENDVAKQFFPNARITIPAGSTKVMQRFYVELRENRDTFTSLFFNECTITRFITHPMDRTAYSYVSGFFGVRNIKSQIVDGYPAS